MGYANVVTNHKEAKKVENCLIGCSFHNKHRPITGECFSFLVVIQKNVSVGTGTRYYYMAYGSGKTIIEKKMSMVSYKCMVVCVV